MSHKSLQFEKLVPEVQLMDRTKLALTSIHETDEEERRLERRAAQGDNHSRQKLKRMRQRAGSEIVIPSSGRDVIKPRVIKYSKHRGDPHMSQLGHISYPTYNVRTPRLGPGERGESSRTGSTRPARPAYHGEFEPTLPAWNVRRLKAVRAQLKSERPKFRQQTRRISGNKSESSDLIRSPLLVESGCGNRKKNDPWRTPGGPKKFAVCATDGGGRAKLVRFGDPGLSIKRHRKGRRENFRARHNCASPGPKTKARYWACKTWEKKKTVKDVVGEWNELTEALNPDDHYIAVRLSPKSKQRLLSNVPAAHKVVQGEHVTLVSHPTASDMTKFGKLHGKGVNFHATHHASDKKLGIQAVRVRGLDHLSEKEHKHITISAAPNTPARLSNDLLAKHNGDRLPDWVRLNGTIEITKRLGKA